MFRETKRTGAGGRGHRVHGLKVALCAEPELHEGVGAELDARERPVVVGVDLRALVLFFADLLGEVSCVLCACHSAYSV